MGHNINNNHTKRTVGSFIEYRYKVAKVTLGEFWESIQYLQKENKETLS